MPHLFKKPTGEIIDLKDKEALELYWERNNKSQRMQLTPLGTTDGSAIQEGKQKVQEFIKEKMPEDAASMDKDVYARTEMDIRQQHKQEIDKIMQDAWNKEVENAKANGITRPSATLRMHTRSKDGHSRQEILGAMNS